MLKFSLTSRSLAFTTKTRCYTLKVPATPTPDFPDEPSYPKMSTSLPGPVSQKLLKEMDKYQV